MDPDHDPDHDPNHDSEHGPERDPEHDPERDREPPADDAAATWAAPAGPRLTVLYDAHCGVCRRARAWLEAEPQRVPLEFVGAGSEEARRRFPGLAPARTLDSLHVVSEAGHVWWGPAAWLTIGWALARWRDEAVAWSGPVGRPLVGVAVALAQALRARAPCDGACGAHAPPRGARAGESVWSLPPRPAAADPAAPGPTPGRRVPRGRPVAERDPADGPLVVWT